MPTPEGLTGAPRRLLNLCSILKDFNIEAVVVSVPDSMLIKEADAAGLQTVIFPLHPVLKIREKKLLKGPVLLKSRAYLAVLFQNIQFLRLSMSSQADAVWIRGSKGIAFAGLGAFLSRKPIIWDIDYELESKGLIRLLHFFGLWCSKAVILQYSKASENIFTLRLALKYKDKFCSLIPGIAFDKLDASKSVLFQDRERTVNYRFVMLQVGTLCERKNQLFTIDALRVAVKNGLGNNWILWFAGTIGSYTWIRDYVRDHGLENNIQFLGWRSDVIELMSKSNLLLMPSKDEGVPNAVQEAMYMGLPVIGSDVGGIPEIIENDVTGWVLPCDAPEKWAEKMTWCKENPAECIRIGNNASRYASDHFSPAHWGGKYAAIMRSVIKKERFDNKSVSS
ncbi:MAG: glycosyltransferase family 4 protein [Chlorobiales bacterium]|nr:glycosyltransferase family 4 protein [Chlorobiales bacterium]